MKRYLLIALAFCAVTVAQAQPSQDSLQALFEMVEQLKVQQQQMAEMAQQREADQERIAELERKLEELKEGQGQDAEANREALLAIEEARAQDSELLQTYQRRIDSLKEQQDRFSAVELRLKVEEEIKYKHIRKNLVNIAHLYELMNDKLNALDAFKQLGAYQNLLQDLNNPSSNTLGFSYNEKVLELMKEQLLPERDRDNSKILSLAKTILESPLATSIKSMVPVVSTANSLLGFLSGISVDKKDITREKFQNFKEELQRYTLYYARMNEANAQFKVSLTQYQGQIKTLHEKLKKQTVANALLMQMRLKNEKDKYSTGEYLLYVFQDYNRPEVQEYFKDLEEEYTSRDGETDYAGLLKKDELQEMYRHTESAMLLFRDFEKLYNQYLQIINDNNAVVTEILEQAKDNNIGKNSMIKSQIRRLEDEKESTKSSVRTAINVPKLTRVASKLSKFPPAL